MPERAASDNDESADNLDNQEVPAAQENDEPTEEDEEEGESETKSSESKREDQVEARAGETLNAYIAKDKTVWNKTPPHQHQTASYNVMRQRSGPHRSTETLSRRYLQ